MKRKNREVHGWSRTPEYGAYTNMIIRCYHADNKNYQQYGGRGIKVCDRWRQSFISFIKDMGPKPSKLHSIDRIDCNGNYEPSNCRWANRSIQTSNQRKRKGTVSKYRGVSFKKENGKWAATIVINRKCHHIGYFSDENEAAKAFDREAIKIGRKLNFENT